jgi:AcrR family transcriptional regulator
VPHRAELLALATDYVLDAGIAGLTLRPLAEGIGSSVASLNRQFGSKEQLVQEVCQELHDRMLRDAAAAQATPAASPVDVLRTMWQMWLAPSKTREFRFLFELYGLALRDPLRYGWFTSSVVHDWMAPIEAALVGLGHSDDDARMTATTVLAVVRGLHLDLAATGDEARVGAAFDQVMTMLEPFLQSGDTTARSR